MPVYPKLLNSQGYSMYPVLLANDVIQVTPISPHDLNIDDIVVFAKKSHYVTHRLVYISKNRSYGITKGDNNLLPDSPIRLRQIKGTILRIYRKNQSLDLKNYYLFQSTYYFDEIKKFKKKLEKQSICYVFLKGLPLHLHFFNQYPQRIFSDCDILIRKESFHQIEVILQTLGYTKQLSNKSVFHNVIKNDIHAFAFVKIRGMFKIVFDIHFRVPLIETKLGKTDKLYSDNLLNSFTNELLNNTVRVRINGDYYPILKKEFLVIYLATHIFHHNYLGYQRYHFLQKIINSSSLDISKIHSIIYNYHLQNYLYPVFILLKKYYPPQIYHAFYDLRVDIHKKKSLQKLIKTTQILKDEDLFQSAFNRMRIAYALSNSPIITKNLLFLSYLVRGFFFIRPQTCYKIVIKVLKKPLFFYNNFFFK